MLKQNAPTGQQSHIIQPPSGGCVLKQLSISFCFIYKIYQPPSGGCVLKQFPSQLGCVFFRQPPSGGCVLKRKWITTMNLGIPSRLQAAVC